ncbi:hypothetical protein MASR2M48_04710 [Spirochaetota bacterium]
MVELALLKEPYSPHAALGLGTRVDTTAFLPEMTRLHPDSRLRDFLQGRPWTSVEIASDGIFIDIDTPEAYEAELLSE